VAPEAHRRGISPNARLALGVLLGRAVGVPAGFTLARLRPIDRDVDAVVVQKGTAHWVGVGDIAVFYPRPFASPPSLRLVPGRDLSGVTLTDQRADGFRLSIVAWNDAGGPLEYEAEGVLAKAVP
jgi:hypothetical protein